MQGILGIVVIVVVVAVMIGFIVTVIATAMVKKSIYDCKVNDEEQVKSLSKLNMNPTK